MSTKLRDALPDIGERFTYDYDFGSTTHLQLTVTGERTGNPAAPASGCWRATLHQSGPA